jgi:hypothetical protein
LTRADHWRSQAVHIRRDVHRLEPQRVDVAVEFAYALCLSVSIAALDAQADAGQAERNEIKEVLTLFEADGLLAARGHDLLTWARGDDGEGL